MARLSGQPFVDNLSSSVPGKPTNKELRYPKDIIADSTDYFKIEVLKYPKTKTNEGGFADIMKGNLISNITANETHDASIGAVASNTIILPIPRNIQDQNGAGWREDQLNDYSAILAQGAMSVMESDGMGLNALMNRRANKDTLTNKAGEVFGDAITSARAQSVVDLIKARAAAAVSNIAGGNVSAEGLRTRATGTIVNQNTELLFNSVKMRAFDFSWDIVPRSEPEAREVKKIIKLLKTRLAPKNDRTQPTGFLNSPDIFRISYMKGGNAHPFLNAFKACALSNMTVNYSASGTYATYDDGTPVHMNMSLKFQELNPIYAEDYGNDSLKGVGY